MRKHSLSSPSRHQHEVGIICILYLSLWFLQNLSLGEISGLCRNCEWWLSDKTETKKQEEKRRWGDENSWWASMFNLNLRVWVGIQWKEGPPGPGPIGLVTWCGDWRHPNCPGNYQRNKQGRRTPREPHWKRSPLWSKMQFSRKWRMVSWFSKTCKDSVIFWRHVEASSLWGQWWEGTGLKTIQHSLLEGSEDDQCPAQGCSGAWNPLITCDGRGCMGTRLDQWGAWLVGYRPSSATLSANMLCYFGWWISFLTPFVHNQFTSFVFFFVCAFSSTSKKSWPNPRSWSFSLMLSSTGCIILVLISRPLIHFELILYIKGSRGPTLFICMWDLVVPAPVLVTEEKYLQVMPPKRSNFQNTQAAHTSQNNNNKKGQV